MCRILTAVFFLCFLSFNSFASSIVPYNNLEHLAISSDLIVIATASNEQSFQQDGVQSFYRNFIITDLIKGQDVGEIKIASGRQVIGEYTNLIHGEFDFHTGDTYLLFLQQKSDGSYYPICLSYYVFEEIQKKGQKFLVPSYEENSLQILKKKKEQILHVYHKDLFVEELKAFSTNKSKIQFSKIIANQEDQQLTQAIKKAAPAHCTYLRTGNGLRFRVENLNSQSLPIYYQNGTAECSAVQSEMQSAVSHMNENFQGISLSLGGSVNGYNPNCGAGRAYDISFFGGTYDTYMDQQLGTSRAVLVQFGDPCNEIPALNNCAGTVAFGGSWAIGSHTAGGETFNTAVYGYVIVNEGMGSCNCGDVSSGSPVSDFSAIIAHELSHTIGLNHISSSFGNANLNPISGTQITNLDVQCVDDLYPSNATSDNEENPEPTSPPPPPPPVTNPDLNVLNCGNVSQTGTTVTVNTLRISNSGNGQSNASRVGFYLSTDNNITTSDRLIGTSTISALSPGASTFINSAFSVAGTPDGSYILGIIVDDTNLVFESNEANNSCSHPNSRIVLTTAPQGEPDLTVNRCGTVSLQTNTVTVNNLRIQNTGPVATSSVIRIQYYASLDQQITTADRLLGTSTVNGLAAGAIATLNHSMAIPNLPDGSYVIGIIIDGNNSIGESNESNNTCFDASPRLIIETEVPDPDLVTNCGSLTVSGSVATLANATIRNIGNAASPAGIQAIVHLTSGESQTTILSRSLPSLSPNATYNLNHTFSTSNLEDGTYTVGISADPTNGLEEENETNNNCTISNPSIVIETEEEVFADLDITNCGQVNRTGNQLTISNVVVRNIGNGSTIGQFFLGYYLSTNQQIDTDDIYLGNDFVNVLEPGTLSRESATFNLASYDLEDGEYFVGIIADFNSRIVESNEANNTCRKVNPKVVIGSESSSGSELVADLTVQCGSVNQTANSVSISNASVRNNGNRNITDGFFNGFYLSTDQTITTDDYLLELGQEYIASLAIGQQRSINGNFSLNGIPAGDYFIGIITDHVGDIHESNENNNSCVISSTRITVGAPSSNLPDLVSSCDQASVIANSIEVTDMNVSNLATIGSGSYSFVGFYISEDQEITTSDFYVGYDYVGILDQGAVSQESESFDISNLPLADGTYYFGAVADFTSRVNESNESNNSCIFSGMQIQIGATPTNEVPENDQEEFCETLSETNFENGQLGPWVDGGVHAFINSGSTFSPSGQRSFALRGDENQQSSIYMRDWVAGDRNSTFNFSFKVRTYQAERGDKFVVEIDKGSGYSILREYEAVVDFDTSNILEASMEINSNNRFKLRIRSRTSHTFEYVFIDDIKLELCNSSQLVSVNAQAIVSQDNPSNFDVRLSPNPVSRYDRLTIDLGTEIHTGTKIQIYNAAGALQQSLYMDTSKSEISIDKLTSGLYYVSIQTEENRVTKKFMVIE